MPCKFGNIGIFTKPRATGIKTTFSNVLAILETLDCNLYFDPSCKEVSKKLPGKVIASCDLQHNCDLVIVIGGDGSLLKAARLVVDASIPLLGVHRGRLGFLADIRPNKVKTTIPAILNGKYIEEQRSILHASIKRDNKTIASHCAVNDVVLYNGDLARLIEFELFIDEQFVLDQRSDGIIIATPTGSTAYSLSGGGPILYPTLNAFALVPMFPHTLSSRPLVIHENSTIKIVPAQHTKMHYMLSCDGQQHINLQEGDYIVITKYPKPIKLLHPQDYNYFAVLREKLGWHN